MQKLAAVEEAKSLFNEAKDWGVWRWLLEKKRARSTADAAWEALDEYEKKVKDAWSDDLKKAYQEAEAEAALDGKAKSRHRYEKAAEEARDVYSKIKLATKKLKEAEVEAYNVHMEAEEIFAEADRHLSTSMACEGAQRALEAWDLREKVIRKAEAVARR